MAENVYAYIGRKIQSYRSQHGMTQEELATKIGVTPNTISRWETATYKPQVADIDNLSRVFKIQIWSFLPSEIQPPTEQLEALLSATGDLPEEDLEELQRYADFIRARNAIKESGKRTRRKRKKEPD